MMIHWFITHLYVKVSYETRQLLDPEVHFNDEGKIQEVYKFRSRLEIINKLVLFLIGLITLGFIVGANHTTVEFITAYTELTLLLVFLGVWAWTLFKLYSDVKNSQKLLPDKKIFAIHGALLFAFLLLFAINETFYFWIKDAEEAGDGPIRIDVLYGNTQIAEFLQNVSELFIFFLVVYLLMSQTKDQAKRKLQF